MKKLLVLAGNAAQVRDFCREYQILPNTVSYVNDESHLKGLQGPPFVVVGTFWDRPDAVRIWTELQIHYAGGQTTYPPFMVTGGQAGNVIKRGRGRGLPKLKKVTEDEALDALDDYLDGTLVPNSFNDKKTFKKMR